MAPAAIPEFQVIPRLKELGDLDIDVNIYGLSALRLLEKEKKLEEYLRYVALRIVQSSERTPLPPIPWNRRPTFRGIHSASLLAIAERRLSQNDIRQVNALLTQKKQKQALEWA